MILKTTLAGLLGPFSTIDTSRADRLICDGAEVPLTVIGEYEQIDMIVPSGYRAEDFDLVDGSLVRKDQTISQPGLLQRLFGAS